MTWAKLADIKEGDTLVADSGFTCIEEGPVIVRRDINGELWVPCTEARHYLNGQLTDDGRLVGFRKES